MKSSNSWFDGDLWPGALKPEHLDWANALVDPGPSPAGNPGPYLKVGTEAGTIHRIYPKIQVGDRLSVREVIDVSHKDYGPAPCSFETDITLEVTGVRCERVQEISSYDAVAEGVEPTKGLHHVGDMSTWSLMAFKELWQSLYPGSWERNEFVWVYSFKRVEGLS